VKFIPTKNNQQTVKEIRQRSRTIKKIKTEKMQRNKQHALDNLKLNSQKVLRHDP